MGHPTQPCRSIRPFLCLLLCLFHLVAYSVASGNDATTVRPLQTGAIRGHYSYDQINDFLSSTSTDFPSIVSPMMSIGSTLEHRDLNVLCIGACHKQQPDDAPAPAILLTGQHHAREPESTMAIIYYVHRLLTRFVSNDPETLALLSTRQLWIFPLVNPDGYVYNQIHSPNAGGMIRKNRKHYGSCRTTAFGIDLNRNYPTCFEHDEDDDGASNDPCREDFRGAEPFSELETQAIRKLIEHPDEIGDGSFDYAFTFALNFHSFGRYINIPFSCQFMEMDPQRYATYQDIARRMTVTNHWPYGRSWEERQLYPVNGEASDWMDAEHQIYAMSPEVGPEFEHASSTGFWPVASTVATLAAETYDLIDAVYWMTAGLLEVSDVSFSSEDCALGVRLDNAGLKDTAGPVSVFVGSSDSSWGNFTQGAAVVPQRSAVTAQVSLNCDPNGEPVLRRHLRRAQAVGQSGAPSLLLGLTDGVVCVVYQLDAATHTLMEGELPQRGLLGSPVCDLPWMMGVAEATSSGSATVTTTASASVSTTATPPSALPSAAASGDPMPSPSASVSSAPVASASASASAATSASASASASTSTPPTPSAAVGEAGGSSATTTPTTTTTTTTRSPTPTASGDLSFFHNVSPVAAEGLGVGLGIGVPVLVLCCALYCVTRRKNSNTSSSSRAFQRVGLGSPQSSPSPRRGVRASFSGARRYTDRDDGEDGDSGDSARGRGRGVGRVDSSSASGARARRTRAPYSDDFRVDTDDQASDSGDGFELPVLSAVGGSDDEEFTP